MNKNKTLSILVCIVLLFSIALTATAETSNQQVITFDFSIYDGSKKDIDITGGSSGGISPNTSPADTKYFIALKDQLSIISNGGYMDTNNKYVHFYGSSINSINCFKGYINKIKFIFNKENQNDFSFDENYSSGIWTASSNVSSITFNTASSQCKIDKIEVTYTPTTYETPLEAQLIFNTAVDTLNYGDLSSIYAISKTGSTGKITYDISELNDNAIATATYNATTNKVDVKAGSSIEGSFTVTASIAATKTHQAETASCHFVVLNRRDFIGNCSYFEKVKNVSDLKDGDQIAFVYVNGANSYAMSEQYDSYRKSIIIPTGLTENLLSANSEDFQILTLEGKKDNWYFNTGEGYLTGLTDEAGMQTKTTKDATDKATITIDSDSKAGIIFPSNSKSYQIKCVTVTNGFSFKCYGKNSSSGKKFYIYKGFKHPINISKAGMATLWTTTPLDFTNIKGIKAYTATMSGNTVAFTRINKVPANTGVLLVSRNNLDITATVPQLESVSEHITCDFVQGNGKSIPSYDGGYTNYILNNGSNGLGFYLANNQIVAETKAYLRLASSEVPAFIGSPDQVTAGINQIQTKAVLDDYYYSPSGIRTNKPQKGMLYIHNHKLSIY